MSKIIMFNSRFWEDSYISDLDPIEKLLFNYAVTNSRVGLIGIYEMPIKNIALETGIEKEMVIKILNRFTKEKKIIYEKGWLCVINYPKYQSYESPFIKIAVNKELALIPKDLMTVFIGYGYPIQTVSIPLKGKGKGNSKDKGKENTDRFDEFWSIYPKKIGKGDAKRSWMKISPTLTGKILEAVELQKKTDQWQTEGGRYIPHPATWLNQERWEDEVSIKNREVIDLSK